MDTWYRSWPIGPKVHDEPRAYVMDHLPRLHMYDWDYRTATPWPEHAPGMFLLEWDVALDRKGRDAFARLANITPLSVSTAPYWIYGPDRVVKNSFGCVYLPLFIVRRFLATDHRFSDGVFFPWYRDQGYRVYVHDSIHPQHIHGD